MDIRRTIQQELERQGMTQKELSVKTKLTTARICDYLGGKRDMTGENLQRLLKALYIELRPTRPRQK